ncbi:MAG: hypothetical protein ACPF8Z_04890 [Schleiferiaceae bacterium]
MKRISILVFLWSSALLGQQNFEAFNTTSFSTNFMRPLMGIVDVNVQVPTTPSQALIAGIHHYSWYYIYDRSNSYNWFSQYGETEFVEWASGNTLAADYRFYISVNERRKKRASYVTFINRLALINRRFTRDIIDNPDIVDPLDPSDPNYDPEWDDGVGSEPRYLPASYDNLQRRVDPRYRFGLEYGRRTLSYDESRFKEMGLAVILNPQGEWWALIIPMVNFRVGF